MDLHGFHQNASRFLQQPQPGAGCAWSSQAAAAAAEFSAATSRPWRQRLAAARDARAELRPALSVARPWVPLRGLRLGEAQGGRKGVAYICLVSELGRAPCNVGSAEFSV